MVSSDLCLLEFLVPFVYLLPLMWGAPNDELLMRTIEQEDDCSLLMGGCDSVLLALLTCLTPSHLLVKQTARLQVALREDPPDTELKVTKKLNVIVKVQPR